MDAVVAGRVDPDALAALDPAQRRLVLRALIARTGGEGDIGAAVERIAARIDGYGPLDPLMRDDSVTDVLVNGPHDVWAERDGRLEPTRCSFDDRDDLRSFVDRMIALAGARADASSPIADGRLPDGSRLHVVLPPLAPDGPLVSIRKFPAHRLGLDDLVYRRMLTEAEAGVLRAAVGSRRALVVTGGTGTGKTTMLNALLAVVGETERVVVIEETPELTALGRNSARLLARPPNIEGRGAVDLATLVRAALRMRPDRIVVGEVRGAEAAVALQAMATGHEGSMLTLHARSAADARSRLVSLALEARTASESALDRAVEDALDVVVHLDRVGGERRVVEIIVP